MAMTIETIGDLLKQTPSSPLSGPTVDIDSNVSLHKEILQSVLHLLNSDQSLVGLTVLSSEGKIEGILSRNSLQDYRRQQREEEGGRARGDLIGQLGGIPLSLVPFYRCDNPQHPLYQRFSSTRPNCRMCGCLMQEIEGEEDV